MKVINVIAGEITREAVAAESAGNIQQGEDLRHLAWDMLQEAPYTLDVVDGLREFANAVVREHKICKTRRGDLFVRMILDDGQQVNYFRKGHSGRRLSAWNG